MDEVKEIIKVLSKLFKIIIGFICIAEEKIKYYHAQKKLRYIILINIILVFMIDIVLSVITYILILILFSILDMKFGLSFVSVLQLYFVIFGIIVFKNLLYKDFNLASKIKVLVLSIFDELTIGIVVKECIFCFIEFCISIFLLGYFIDKYIVENNINDIKLETTFNIIIIASLIITFVTYVYGANEAYVNYKRKLMFYGIATILTLITTLDSLKEMYNSSKVDVLNLKSITLAVTMVLAIDKFIIAYTSLIKEYNNRTNELINRSEEAEKFIINIKDISKSSIEKIKLFISETKKMWLIYKSFNKKRKMEVIAYCIGSIIIIVLINKFMPFISILIIRLLDRVINNIIYNIQYNNNGINGLLWGLMRFIGKLIIGIVLIVALIVCINYIVETLLNIKSIFRQKIRWQKIKKELGNLFNRGCFLMCILMLLGGLIGVLDNKLIMIIITGIAYIDIGIPILWCIAFILEKIQDRLNRYNEE